MVSMAYGSMTRRGMKWYGKDGMGRSVECVSMVHQCTYDCKNSW